MKKLKIYAAFLIVGLLIYGCEKPAPTELIQSDQSTDDPASIQVITKNLNNDSTGTGYDSTGVTDDITKYNNVIIVSGVKITDKSLSVDLSFAQGLFFDKNNPVYDSGGNVVSYKTRFVGNLFFDGNKARLIPHRVLNFIISDSLYGTEYILYNRNLRGDGFTYNYDSQIHIRLAGLLNLFSYDFTIPTLPEVTGSVNLDGTREAGNLKAVLKWNANLATKMIINIGASPIGKSNVVAIYQIKTKDDGRFIIPSDLLNAIPANKFDKLYVSLVRQVKVTKQNERGTGNLTVFSQSVHTIIIEDR